MPNFKSKLDTKNTFSTKAAVELCWTVVLNNNFYIFSKYYNGICLGPAPLCSTALSIKAAASMWAVQGHRAQDVIAQKVKDKRTSQTHSCDKVGLTCLCAMSAIILNPLLLLALQYFKQQQFHGAAGNKKSQVRQNLPVSYHHSAATHSHLTACQSTTQFKWSCIRARSRLNQTECHWRTGPVCVCLARVQSANLSPHPSLFRCLSLSPLHILTHFSLSESDMIKVQKAHLSTAHSLSPSAF